MQLADFNGKLIEPQPGFKAICPGCKCEVIAKCGTINVWHWAHLKDADCDTWSEPETKWHIYWKSCFPKENREVIIKDHRADVYWMGRVIEFQHSEITYEQVNARENCYINMIWVVDASTFWDHLIFKSDKYCRWLWMKKCWAYAMKPVFLQFGSSTIRIIKFYDKGFLYEKINTSDFKKQYLNLRITE